MSFFHHQEKKIKLSLQEHEQQQQHEISSTSLSSENTFINEINDNLTTTKEEEYKNNMENTKKHEEVLEKTTEILENNKENEPLEKITEKQFISNDTKNTSYQINHEISFDKLSLKELTELVNFINKSIKEKLTI